MAESDNINAGPSTLSRRCIKVWVTGRVQGVSFRDYTRRQAQQLGIQGHAINLSDGRVEVLASGEEDALQQFIRWLHQGSPSARVDDLLIEDLPYRDLQGFRIG